MDNRSKKVRRVPLTNLMKSGRALRISSTSEQREGNDMEGSDFQATKHSHGDDERYSFTGKDTSPSAQPDPPAKSRETSNLEAQPKQEHQDAAFLVHSTQGAKNSKEGRSQFVRGNMMSESAKLDSETLTSNGAKIAVPAPKSTEKNSAVSALPSKPEVVNAKSESVVQEPVSIRASYSDYNNVDEKLFLTNFGPWPILSIAITFFKKKNRNRNILRPAP